MVTDVENSALPEPALQRPLRLLYLFVFVTCVAVSIAWSNRIFGLAIEPSAIFATYLILHGLRLAAIPIAIHLRWRGEKFPFYPGEWLWFAQGIAVLVSMTFISLAPVAEAIVGMTFYLWMMLLAGLVWLLPAVKTSGSKLWRTVYWCAFITDECQCLISFLILYRFADLGFEIRHQLDSVLRITTSVLAIAAGLFGSKPRWLWSIWIGIAIYVAAAISNCLESFVLP